MSRQDVIIVGAPRSGTNMLRDVLTAFPGVETWPCDEINLIWRHGNRDQASDELTAEMAGPAVTSFIDRAFDRLARRTNADMVVEKTCATSLRPEFTRAVKPDAKYLFITRDGLDAAASAIERWNAPFDLRYTAKKVRFVPLSDLPHYGTRFAATALRRRQAQPQGLTTWWGPRPRDYRELMEVGSLDDVTAIQWQRCVDRAAEGLRGLPDDQLLHVSYEEFVREPVAGLAVIAEFLGLPEGDHRAAVAGVSASSIGKGRAKLGPERVAHLEELVGSTLRKFGYAG